ncbi:MAG: PDZ domain-containing protein [Chloroflexi bacterium]|nr:PDZ domain-containing protein [Chloroflexota bacterium]
MRSKIALFLLVALFIGSVAIASAALSQPVLQDAVPTAAPTPTPLADSVYTEIDAMNQAVSNLYQRISPSVVHVTTQTQTVDFFYGTVPQEGTGSGFVYDHDGHIVTNDHVIQGADQVNVLLAGGTSLPATVIGYDSYYDLAVLRVDAPANTLTPLQLGDSTQLQVGQSVAAIGNPFGLEGTLTTGIVSALGRQIQTDSGGTIGQAIQTDAAINPGNSGGPLLDMRGRVVGINTAINSPSGGSVGIGFAVPSEVIARVVPVLISTGHFPHASLDATLVELGTELQPAQGEPNSGLLVAQLVTGGAGEKAGLKAANVTRQFGRLMVQGGDVITAVDGHPVASRSDLQSYLENNHKPGDQVTLSVVRGGKTLEVSLTLSEQTKAQ